MCTPARLQALGVGRLPSSLGDALDALAADPVITAALGDTLIAQFLRLKREECRDFAQHVGEWELQRDVDAF